MKISIVTSPFCELPPDAIGAVERLWADMAGEFARQGHSIELLGKRGKTVLPSERNLKRTYIRGYGRAKSVYFDIILDFFYSFRALGRMGVCDVLVCNTFWTPILAPLFFRRKFKRLVYNVERFPKIQLKMYRRVDLFACASTPVRAELIRLVPSFENRARVIPNPINIDVFNASVRPDSHGELRIGYHGRIHVEKGIDRLAEAVSKLSAEFSQIRLRMIGPSEVSRGGSGEAYRRKLDELSKKRIEWVEAISNPEMLAASLRECLIYCYPSVAEKGETFGVSPLEAMGLGLPVVVSKLECFADFAKNGVNALVFNHRANDATDQLVHQLRRLLLDAKLRDSLSERAYATTRRFSTTVVASNYLLAFEELVN